MSKQTNILIFIDWFTPAFKAGGPIKSVTNIIKSLHQEYTFFIVTSDRDINESTPLRNVILNDWITMENYSIIYLSPENRHQWIKNHLTEKDYDAYYFNSLFSKNFTLKPLLILNRMPNKKIIVAPRGMLGEGALAIKSSKKKTFLGLAKLLGYYKNVLWHATNKEEQYDIIKVFGESSNIKIASNISLCEVVEKEIIKEVDQLKLVFFSRISPKKNLIYAINLLKEIKHVTLTIYGSIEDDQQWTECKDIIEKHNLPVTYGGEILPKDVNNVLSDYHFFILPTLHENYGHVIVEALTAGCGLIISDNTPWRNLASKKIGWDINLNHENKFITTLKYCIAMEQNEYNTIRNNCYNFVRQEINTKKEIEDTIKLFE